MFKKKSLFKSDLTSLYQIYIHTFNTHHATAFYMAASHRNDTDTFYSIKKKVCIIQGQNIIQGSYGLDNIICNSPPRYKVIMPAGH